MSNPVVRIAKGRARPFWFGCPIVFSGSVAGVDGKPAPGALVDVHDDQGQTIGRGFYNPSSSYSVRIIDRSRNDAGADEIIDRRIHEAFELRGRLGLPGSSDTVFRLVNSEGDNLSGVTVDVFDDVAVVMESAFWVSGMRRGIEAAIRRCLGGETRVVFRVVGSIRGLEGISAPDEGDLPAKPVVVRENDLMFDTFPGRGQKTGFYADQRENRRAIRRFCAGAAVLDLFSFSGGFALNAAAGGAAAVTAVDSSAEAIEAGVANASRNGCDGVVNFVREDAEKFLGSCGTYDVVICDPPKLATGRQSMEAALKHYRHLNVMAVKAVRDGGILVSCSCSSVVRREDFVGMLRDAAGFADREMRVIDISGAGPDHPVSPAWPEGEYLKAVTAVVRQVGRT